MRDMGMVRHHEPAARLFTQGMIIKDGAKMSKSLGNVVTPDEMVERYGADSARMYTLFATSPDSELDWQDSGVEGVSRFLARAYRFVAQRPMTGVTAAYSPNDLTPQARGILRKLHQTIRKITEDFSGRWHFNTSVAALMELLNQCLSADELFAAHGDHCAPRPFVADVQRKFVLLLAPFAPYLANELWEMLGEKDNLLRAPWPKYDPELAKEEEIEIPVQVNGKLRGRIVVPADSDDGYVRERALADEKVKAAIAGKPIAKVIIVPGKLVSLVVR
jgi:leucyl-tRNA synthetase